MSEFEREASIYFNKAVNTCVDNDTTSTTWYFNFTRAFDYMTLEKDKYKEENEEMKKQEQINQLMYSQWVAMKKYVVHKDMCGDLGWIGKCTCGLTELLK